MTSLFFKRAGAYVFDLLIISLVVSLFSYIPFLNPNRLMYSEKYNELVMVREQLDQNEISMEEYEQAYRPIAYQIYRLNTNYVIIDLVCIFLYFVIFQYFFHGQTLGKRFFQIRVVRNDEKEAGFVNYFLRSIVLSNMLITIALQAIVYIFSVDNYYSIYSNVNLVGSIILYVILFMALVRQDGRGLHDFVGNTKVVSTILENKEKEEKVKEEQKVMEAEFEIPREELKKSEEKVVKKTTTKKKVSEKKKTTKKESTK